MSCAPAAQPGVALVAHPACKARLAELLGGGAMLVAGWGFWAVESAHEFQCVVGARSLRCSGDSALQSNSQGTQPHRPHVCVPLF